jgi:putative ABC transport system substrate-binding protein
MRRREFLTFLGAAAPWPLAVRAQQAPRPRRIGILMPYPPSDRAWQSRVAAFRQELQRLGWAAGGNIELDERWTTDDMDLCGPMPPTWWS